MALDDIVFDSLNSSQASRGNGGVLVDIALPKPTAYVSPNYFGGYWSVSETFKDSADAFFPDGTTILAFHGTTHALVGTGTTTTGVATFVVSTSADVYLVAILAGGETVRTTAITPT